MSNARTKIAAQDIALKALRTAAQAEPDKDVAAEIVVIASQLAKRWGVKE